MDPTCLSWDEINVSALRIGADQFNAQSVSHIFPLPVDQQAFHMGLQHPDKGSLGSSAGHDSVKYLADAAAHAYGRNPLGHSTLNFSRSVFFYSAVGCDSGKLI